MGFIIVLGAVAFIAYKIGGASGEKKESTRVRMALEAAEDARQLALKAAPAPELPPAPDELTQQIMAAQNEKIRRLEEQLRGVYGRQQAPSSTRDRVSSPRNMLDL